MKSSSDPTPIKPRSQKPAELEDQIRRRAYELYEQRGRVDGHELEDWLQAEAELLSVKGRKTAA
ncbi:MAG TPA: DUF2934 domain-containing protein [Terriglobales bacterium]|nr:DUF2934 domain-containing protein [Terriglobales bacterium]